MRLLPAAFLLLLTSLPAFAAESVEEDTVTWYDVELIVFRNLDTRSTETWPADAGTPAIGEARPLFPPEETSPIEDTDAVPSGLDDAGAVMQPGMPTPYVPLEKSAYQLGGIAGSLQRSTDYEMLLHVAWTQPPLERAQAPYLRLALPGSLEAAEPEAGETFPGNESPPLLGRTTDIPADDETTDELPEPSQGERPDFLAEEETVPQPARPLDGVVQLSVSRYLHLDLDLLYLPGDLNLAVLDDVPAATREWTEQEEREREERHRAILDALARGDITLEEAEILSLEPEQDVFQGFRLNQFRRLRSGDIHYFDHPVYGVIVKVTPREVSARMLESDAMARPQDLR